MKLRYRVDMNNCFRRGIDCDAVIQVIEVDPKNLPEDVRKIMAERLRVAIHNGQEVLDVCTLDIEDAYIDAEEDGGVLTVYQTGHFGGSEDLLHLLQAELPGIEHLIEALKSDEIKNSKYFQSQNFKYNTIDVFKGGRL